MILHLWERTPPEKSRHDEKEAEFGKGAGSMGEENFAAVEALYQAKGRLIFTLAYRLVNQRERAEDLVQEVFLLALTHQEAILHHPNQVGWLVQALKHLASNELRRAENRLTVPLEEDLLPACWPREALEELLPNGLSRQDRQVLLWRMEEQCAYPEMARRLGISETGCRSRVARAVARCRLLMLEEKSPAAPGTTLP